jgi:hypothetical protein
LLALAHYSAGRVKLDTGNEALAIQIWGKPNLDSAAFLSPALRQIAAKVTSKVPILLGYLRAHSSGTKGGQVGRFVSMAPAFTAIRALRARSLQLAFVPPEKSESPEVQGLIDLYRVVKDELPTAIDEERQARSEWYRSTSERLGEQTRVSSLINTLRDLINDVVNGGISSGITRTRLEEVLNDLRPQTLDNVLGHGAAIAAANASDTMIRAATIGVHGDEIMELISRAEGFINAVAEFINNQEVQYGQQAGDGLADSETRIFDAITSILKALDTLADLPRRENESA